ncbi:MAG TPA: response regulator transcription factor [Verrucomicrobiae bacterium]|nr:response regulator transcription factor [Verrucomicrobiae bacterium]
MAETKPKPITVSIVEEDGHFRESVGVVIGRTEGFQWISYYKTADQACRYLPREKPDVAFVDALLPGGSGVDCVAKLKSLAPRIEIILLTTYEDGDKIFDALRAGASGYLLKTVSAGFALEAIRDVLAGRSPASPTIARRVMHFFSQPGLTTQKLTQTESTLLRLLGQGADVKEFESLELDAEGVRAEMRKIYRKLRN